MKKQNIPFITWIETKTASKLLSRTPNGVRNLVRLGIYLHRYIPGIGRGGRVLQIALESLPQAAQDRYHGMTPTPASVLQYTGKQRDGANLKAWIVEQHRQSGLSVKEFISTYNADLEPEEQPINESQLYRWQAKYKTDGVSGLIDRRGGYNRGQDTIPEEVWNCFYALYMTQQGRSIQLCYDLTRRRYPDMPSVSTFMRKVRKIPLYALLYYRKGPKAAKDMMPSIERSKLDIESNSIWFSDHHKIDVFVKSEDGQHVIRPWLTVFFDARSNRVMSFVVREADPNAAVVKKSFRLGVEASGIPMEVYFDNGKDYKSKSFNRDYPMSLVNQLNIGVIHATKYHGQAKTVERFFGTFTSRFSRRFDTYTGKDAKNRPECMDIPNREILKIAPDFANFVALVSDYMAEYNATASSGADMDGKCPDQVYAENLATRREVRDHDALRLLCGTSEERTVHKNGVSINNNNYYHELLAHHVGEKVIVVFDPDNLDKANIFDSGIRAICVAEAKIKTPFRATTEEDYKRASKQRKAARDIIKRHQPVRDIDLHTLISRNQLIEQQYTASGVTSVIDYVAPQLEQNAKILRDTDKPISDRRIRREDSVSAALMEVYQKQA